MPTINKKGGRPSGNEDVKDNVPPEGRASFNYYVN